MTRTIHPATFLVPLLLIVTASCSPITRQPEPGVAWLAEQGWHVTSLGNRHEVTRDNCTDEDLGDLVNEMGRLETIDLDVSRSAVTDAGIAKLRSLPGILTLNAAGCSLGDTALASISGWTDVETLLLSDTAVTDTGLQHLAGLLKIELLSLRGCQGIKGPGLAHLRSPVLTTLELGGTLVDDAGFASLPTPPKLSTLELDGTKITDATLSRLESFPELQEVTVRGVSGLSDESIESLEDSNSAPDVVRDP